MTVQDLNITLEEDATPIVRLFANTFQQTLQRPAGQKLIKGLNAKFALKSSKDAQAVTVSVSGTSIHLEHGVAEDAAVIFTMNFDKPDGKPEITGLLKHPLLSYRLGKILTLPLPSWTDSAKRFWRVAETVPDVPDALVVTSADDGRTLHFGEGDSVVEIKARSSELEKIFAGNVPLLQEVMTGKVQIRSGFRYIAGLSQTGQRILLGEAGE
jgi:hypothetical protein